MRNILSVIYPRHLFEDTSDEKSPAQIAQKNAQALGPTEGVQLVSEEHAEHGVLVLCPLAEVPPPL